VIVPKFLVPDNATFATSARVEKRLADGLTQGAPMLIRASALAGLAPRKKLFAESILENSPTRPARRARDFCRFRNGTTASSSSATTASALLHSSDRCPSI